MRKLKLSIISGLLLAFSWPEIGFFPLIIIAFIPLFIFESEISQSNLKNKGRVIFGYSFLTFFIFNIATTYWIWHATIGGAFFAFIVNAFLMASVFWLFYKSKSILGDRLGYVSFIVFWISMEYLHLNWDLAWPWLILGNVFSNAPSLVQWYEFTGVLGGSVFVFLLNLSIYKQYFQKKEWKKSLGMHLIIISPFIISLLFFNNEDSEIHNAIEVVIVQPNIDPYTEKFTITSDKQLDHFISIAKNKLTPSTDLLIGPETVLQESIWEHEIHETRSIRELKILQDSFPELSILLGATTYKLFNEYNKISSTARKIKDADLWYDCYNSAIFLSSNDTLQIYHKTKLVPGVEGIPYPRIFGKLADLIVNLGGSTSTLSKENDIYSFKKDSMIIKPLICYESVFGDLDYTETSNLLCVITNDGWWKKTAGYKQHLSYASLRAIEQRKNLVRSANTGISAIISSSGRIVQKTKWNEAISIRDRVAIIDSNTFYNRFGDYIGRISSFIAVMIMLIMLIKYKIKESF